MPPRSPQPKKSRKPTTRKAVKKTVTPTRSGGVNAKAKKINVTGDVVGRDRLDCYAVARDVGAQRTHPSRVEIRVPREAYRIGSGDLPR